MQGLRNPDDGEISVDNKTVFLKYKIFHSKDRKVAVVFQNYALLPHLSIALKYNIWKQSFKDELKMFWKNKTKRSRK